MAQCGGDDSCEAKAYVEGAGVVDRPTVARLLLPFAGDSRGYVDVYKIVGVDLTPDITREEQVERLRQAVMTTDREGSTSKG